MYVHGTLQRGVRAIPKTQDEENLDEQQLAEFGIDWTEWDRGGRVDRDARDAERNPDPPDMSNVPEQLSHVEVPETRSPFAPELIQHFVTSVRALPSYASHHYLQLWSDGLYIMQIMLDRYTV